MPLRGRGNEGVVIEDRVREFVILPRSTMKPGGLIFAKLDLPFLALNVIVL